MEQAKSLQMSAPEDVLSNNASVQRLKQHEELLMHVVQNWCLQQEQILQAMFQSLQENMPTEKGETFNITQKDDICLPTSDPIIEDAQSEYATPIQVVQHSPLKRQGTLCTPRIQEDVPPKVSSNKDLIDRAPSDVINRASIDVVTRAAMGSSEMWRQSFSRSEIGTVLLPSEQRQESCMQRVVSSNLFEGASALCILVNAGVIAYGADYAAHNVDSPRNMVVDKFEVFFAVFYSMELILRLIAFRLQFFCHVDWKWNVFDTMLVVSALYDQAVELISGSKGAKGNVVFLRVVRIMKMIKLLRMVRIMRMFKELRLIVGSIKGSMKSMLWAVLLIVIITYVVGLCFLQAGTAYLQEHGAKDATAESIRLYWGDVSQSMLSLYSASTNGEGWKDMANALIPMGYMYYVLFLLYIAFFLFVVMNTLTSLFIEATIQNAERDKHVVIRHEIQRKSDYKRRAAELFLHIDHDASGDISEEEFHKHAADPEMVAFAWSLELDVTDIAQFYSMLSCRGRYTVDLDTFVVGCMKLKGYARSMDLQGLIATQKRTTRMVEGMFDDFRRIGKVIEEKLPDQGSAAIPVGSAETADPDEFSL